MAPRSRSPKRRGFPDNLYETGGYYSWKHPATGRHHGLGRNKADAFEQAIEANMLLEGEIERPRLVDRLSGIAGQSVGDWLDHYEKLLARRKLADNTRRSYRSMLKRARLTFSADLPMRAVTTAMVADALDALIEEGKERAAQAFRSFLQDCFREAVAQGWVERNPAEPTRAVSVTVKRARLTLDVFRQVYEAETLAWLRNAMALALVTAQRREDIVRAQFKRDIRDGAWWVDQGKTGSRLIIPGELRLDAFGMSLSDVVSQCRATGAVSQHLIHQTRAQGNSPVGSKIWVDTLSRRFSEALARQGIDWGERRAPTFHEIRSLSERLYKAQGNVNTQELLGHKDPRTTALYHDARGEWVRVAVR